MGMASDGRSCIHWAAIGGKPGTIPFLVSRGVNVNARDGQGATSLHYAAQENHPKCIVELILAGADVSLEDHHGRTPLVWAVLQGSAAALASLLAAKANVNTPDRQGFSPLHYAADTGNAGMCLALLGVGANIDAVSKDGQTPLVRSIRHRQVKVVDLLLSNKASVTIVDESGKSALHWACSCGLPGPAIKSLISLGSDIILSDHRGWQPLHDACQGASIDGFDVLLESKLESKRSVNKVTNDGMTPLHITVKTRCHDILGRLLALGAKVNHVLHVGDKSRTPMDVARDALDIEAVRSLASFGGITYDDLADLSAALIQLSWRIHRLKSSSSESPDVLSHLVRKYCRHRRRVMSRTLNHLQSFIEQQRTPVPVAPSVENTQTMTRTRFGPVVTMRPAFVRRVINYDIALPGLTTILLSDRCTPATLFAVRPSQPQPSAPKPDMSSTQQSTQSIAKTPTLSAADVARRAKFAQTRLLLGFQGRIEALKGNLTSTKTVVGPATATDVKRARQSVKAALHAVRRLRSETAQMEAIIGQAAILPPIVSPSSGEDATLCHY